MLHEAGEKYGVLESTFAVIKGRARPMDLATVVTPSTSHFSFLSLGWAIISDVDIESERYRCLGSARFTIGAVERIIWLRRYPGRFSYLPMPEDGPAGPAPQLPDLSEPVPSDWVTIEDSFEMFYVTMTSHAAHDMYTSPRSRIGDGKFTILLLRGNRTRAELLTMFLGIEDGTHINHAALEMITTQAYRLEPLVDRGIYSLDGEIVPYGPIQSAVLPRAARLLAVPGRDDPADQVSPLTAEGP